MKTKSLILLLVLCFCLTAKATTYYVSKDGNDTTGDGTTWALAELTIGAAVTDASAGDTIDINTGTYLESGTDLTLKEDMTVIGNGWSTLITQDTLANCTVVLSKGNTLRNLSVSHTATPTNSEDCKAVYGNAKTNVLIDNCQLISTGTPLMLVTCNNITVRNSTISAAEYGIFSKAALSIASIFNIEGCTISTSGWDICATVAICAENGTYNINNCTLNSHGLNAAGSSTVGVTLNPTTNGIVNISNSTIITFAEINLKEKGLFNATALGNIVATNCTIKGTVSDNCYSLYNTTTGKIYVKDSSYNYNKTYGKIIVASRNRSRYESPYWDGRR